MTTPVDIDAVLRAAEKATARPWKFRATKDSGGIKFVVANEILPSGMEFIAADCSHGYNGRFIALACNSAVAMAEEIRGLRKENERLKNVAQPKSFCIVCGTWSVDLVDYQCPECLSEKR